MKPRPSIKAVKMKKKILLIGVILLSLLALLAVLHRNPFVDKTLCVGCEDCVRVCPTQAITVSSQRAEIDPAKCIDCKLCVRACPQRAIKVPQ